MLEETLRLYPPVWLFSRRAIEDDALTDYDVPEGTDVYLTMGGGCQGCAMSAATLREGITVMISEMIPEVTEVIDTTDHTAGETPYYQ